MKKLLKKVLILIMILLVIITITGCGNKENNIVEENSEIVEENTEKTKTFSILNKVLSSENYVMILQGKTDIGEGEEEATISVATKSGNIYMDVNAISEHATIMYKDGITYIISHDKKIYTTIQGKDEEIFNEDTTFISESDLKNIEEQESKNGKEIIDEIEYDYEEFNIEEKNIVERYYFLNDDLKYIKSIYENGNEELMKIIKLSTEVEDYLFNIPTGYENVSVSLNSEE